MEKPITVFFWTLPSQTCSSYVRKERLIKLKQIHTQTRAHTHTAI